MAQLLSTSINGSLSVSGSTYVHGNVIPGARNTYYLGTWSSEFAGVYTRAITAYGGSLDIYGNGAINIDGSNSLNMSAYNVSMYAGSMYRFELSDATYGVPMSVYMYSVSAGIVLAGAKCYSGNAIDQPILVNNLRVQQLYEHDIKLTYGTGYYRCAIAFRLLSYSDSFTNLTNTTGGTLQRSIFCTVQLWTYKQQCGCPCNW